FFTNNHYLKRVDYFPNIEVFEDIGVKNVIISYGNEKSEYYIRRVFRNNFKYSEEKSFIYPESFRLDHTKSLISSKNVGVDINTIFYISIGIVGNSDEKKYKGEFKVGDLLCKSKSDLHNRLYFEGKDIEAWKLKN